MISNDEKILHDYFDNILSVEEQQRFEETLIDNIDLAIELGKLKNLHRNLRNLGSNFDPSDEVIENIIDSLLEGKRLEEKKKLEVEEKDEKKKKPKKIKKPKKKKERRKLKAKTKYRLNQLLTATLVLILIGFVVAGYFYYKKETTTFPWQFESGIGNSHTLIASDKYAQFKTGDVVSTKNNEYLKITIPSKVIIEMNENSKIKIGDGSQSYNSVNFISGKINFIPLIGNEILDVFLNNITLESTNSEFEIVTQKNKLPKISVHSNSLAVIIDKHKIRVPFNHSFVIYNRNEISIPILENANKDFAKTIAKYDLSKDEKLIAKIISKSNRFNAFSLHFLLRFVSPTNREAIINRLEKFFPLPSGVSKNDILILDDSALQKWWDKIYDTM